MFECQKEKPNWTETCNKKSDMKGNAINGFQGVHDEANFVKI